MSSVLCSIPCPGCNRNKLHYHAHTDTIRCTDCSFSHSYSQFFSLISGAQQNGGHRRTPQASQSHSNPSANSTGPAQPGTQASAGAAAPAAPAGACRSMRDLEQEYNKLQSRLDLDHRRGKISSSEYHRQKLQLKQEFYSAVAQLNSGWPTVVNIAPVASPAPIYSPKTLTLAQAAAILNIASFRPSMMIRITEEEKSPRVPLPVEQSFGEITAFRVWRIQTSSGLLTSSYMDEVIWKPQETLQSHCIPKDYDEDYDWGILSPNRTGIHGWKSVIEVVEYGKKILDHEAAQNFIGTQWGVKSGRKVSSMVIGRVHLWGHVIEHERGYRAEFCRIISIDDCWGQDQKWNGAELERLQQLYFPKTSSNSNPAI